MAAILNFRIFAQNASITSTITYRAISILSKFFTHIFIQLIASPANAAILFFFFVLAHLQEIFKKLLIFIC